MKVSLEIKIFISIIYTMGIYHGTPSTNKVIQNNTYLKRKNQEKTTIPQKKTKNIHKSLTRTNQRKKILKKQTKKIDKFDGIALELKTMIQKNQWTLLPLVFIMGLGLGTWINGKKTTNPQEKTIETTPLGKEKYNINQPVKDVTHLIKDGISWIQWNKQHNNIAIRSQFNQLFTNKNTTFFNVLTNLIQSANPTHGKLSSIGKSMVAILDINNIFLNENDELKESLLSNANQEKSHGLEYIPWKSLVNYQLLEDFFYNLKTFCQKKIKEVSLEPSFQRITLENISQVIYKIDNVLKALPKQKTSEDILNFIKAVLEQFSQEIILFVHHYVINIPNILESINKQTWLSQIISNIDFSSNIQDKSIKTFKEILAIIKKTHSELDTNNYYNSKDSHVMNIFSNSNTTYFIWKFLLHFLWEKNIENGKIFKHLKNINENLNQLNDEDYAIIKDQLKSLIPQSNTSANNLSAEIIQQQEKIIDDYVDYQRKNIEIFIKIKDSLMSFIKTSWHTLWEFINNYKTS